MTWGHYDPTVQDEEYDSCDEYLPAAAENMNEASKDPLHELPAFELQSVHEDDSEDEDDKRLKNSEDADEGADSDIDKDGAPYHAPATSKEKRAAQNAIFRAFAVKKEAQITEKSRMINSLSNSC
jgi:endoribonuclease Dicer